MTKEAPVIDLDKLPDKKPARRRKKRAGHGTSLLMSTALAASSLSTTSVAPDMVNEAYQTLRDTRHSAASEYLSQKDITEGVTALQNLFNDTVQNHPNAFITELTSALPSDQDGQTITYWQESQDPKKAGMFYDISLITSKPTTPDEKESVVEIRYEEKSLLADATGIKDESKLRLIRSTNDPNKWYIYQNGRWLLYPYPFFKQVYFVTGEPIYPMTRDDFEKFSEKVESSLHAASK